MLRALAGDGQNDVRVDGREGDVDDLEFFARILFAQQHFQVTIRAAGRLGITHRRRFTQNKNAERAGRLVSGHPDREGKARGFRRKKTEAEIIVLNVAILAADFEALEKMRVVTVAAQPQGNFQHAQQGHRQQQRRQPEKPFTECGRGGGRFLARRIGFFGLGLQGCFISPCKGRRQASSLFQWRIF